jgi:hypothetical protein
MRPPSLPAARGRQAKTLGGGQQLGGGERAPGVAREHGQLGARDRDAEEVGRHVLEQVRLVEDHRVVVGDRAAGMIAAQRQVGEEQVVVDDHQLRLFGALAHLRHEARFVVPALAADARVGAALDLAPDRRVLGQVELGAVAAAGVREPVLHQRQVQGGARIKSRGAERKLLVAA